MKEQILSTYSKGKFHNYFAAPVLSELYGYAMFFTVLLTSKVFAGTNRNKTAI